MTTHTQQTHSVEDVPALPDDTIHTLDYLIKRHTMAVLLACGGNRRRTASDLGISRSTLYRMLDRYGVAK